MTNIVVSDAQPSMIDPASIEAALTRIDHGANNELDAGVGQGIALGITDRTGVVAVRTYGFANVDAAIPVTGDTLFEIGSIGKSFTAIVFMQLAGDGIVDLHAPVTQYLPWFEVQSEFAPITVHHLLTHTGGITGGSDHVADARYEVWCLRNTRAFASPGEHFLYSNLGYKTLGLILEEVLQQSYAEIIRERIYQPLGMSSAWAEITAEMRPNLAVGYSGRFDDRPWLPRHGVVPATWLETNTGDGCLSMSVHDLLAYTRSLLSIGHVNAHPLLTAAQFETLRFPHIGDSPDPTYGYALNSTVSDGIDRVAHSGGMVGYVSHMVADRAADLGVVVLANGGLDVGLIAQIALDTLSAVRLGNEMPELPNGGDPFVVTNSHDFAGAYDSDSGSVEIVAGEDSLTLVTGNLRVPLRRYAPRYAVDMFIADHPDLDRFPITFGRDAPDADPGHESVPAHVVELFHGDDWYAGQAYEGVRTFDVPDEWKAYEGHYRSHNPWYSNFRIAIRKGNLVMLSEHGATTTLVPEGKGFRVGDQQPAPDWLTFDAIVDGKALVARSEAGEEFARFFTP